MSKTATVADSAGTCEWCGTGADRRFSFELEWPGDGADGPGYVSLEFCGDCANRLATNVLVDRAVTREIDVDEGVERTR